MCVCVTISPIVVLFVFASIFAEIQCYEWRYGTCFAQVYEPCPVDGPVRFLFKSSEDDPNVPAHTLDPNKPILPQSYNQTAALKVIIHGYGGHLDSSSPLIAQGYLSRPGFNVVFVNWMELADLPCYPVAVVNTWQAGRCTAVLLASLVTLGVHPKSMHLVGFSLGAHVASITSNLLQDVLGSTVGRITGLDPALPLYATLSLHPTWILDSNDADFVDIIHTNAGLYGKLESTGHVDFYMNGGTSQPACDNSPTARLCSHLMAPIYFTESISSEVGFWGDYYPSYFHYVFGWYPDSKDVIKRQTLMGEHCPKTTRGVYFVVTHHAPPFALGKY